MKARKWQEGTILRIFLFYKSRDLFSVTKKKKYSEEHVFVVAVEHDCSRADS